MFSVFTQQCAHSKPASWHMAALISIISGYLLFASHISQFICTHVLVILRKPPVSDTQDFQNVCSRNYASVREYVPYRLTPAPTNSPRGLDFQLREDSPGTSNSVRNVLLHMRYIYAISIICLSSCSPMPLIPYKLSAKAYKYMSKCVCAKMPVMCSA